MSADAELIEIPVANGQIAVLDTGQPEAVAPEPPIVLLHGGALDHRMWRPQIELLRGMRRVIAPDARGHGQSSTPTAPFRHDIDLIGVLDGLGVAQAVVVGLSMGASIGVDLAIAHPERVAGLIVVGAGVSSPTFTDPWVLDVFTESAKAAQAGDGGAWLEQYLRFVTGPRRTADEVVPAVLTAVREMMTDTLRNHVPDGEPVLPSWLPDAADRIGEIGVPVLAIAGGADADDHLRMPAELVAGVADGRMVTIPGTAHYPNLERPEQFNSELLRFLATTD
ncbi:alpha/beta fold hydrolase [Epidermidibacterium keratini]|uniref:Alpha/beta fold hydrolase n=1 Tax=Epidermidibacterium keratini TaxID=1891644 RepID=A0A7L4YMC0_9ACTN|nr:alpha/beta fold hydrolase [Epidermidibacterium keratini]QHC00023.1 alpha/beta fold hydrolase [Epidermidibacterium keratini]